MMKLIRRRWPIVLILGLVLIGGGTYLYRDFRVPAAQAKAGAGKTLYRCPMHPNYTSERPGDCLICGMRLVPVEQPTKARSAPAAGSVRAAAPAVAGQATIQLTPEKQQLIGVRTAPVARQALTTTLRAVGQVTADETAISRVHTKVSGWVDKLYVNFTGAQVRKGQPLLSIYSPELVATQQEYLLALRARQRLRQSTFPEVAASGDSLLAATRRRLELWDVPDREIQRIERTGQPIKSVTLYAPASGYVMDKPVLQGQRVDPGTELMVVADLDSVWVEAEFYEQDASLVRPGQAATLTVNAYPELSWNCVVDYIFPAVDPQTRTLRARLRVPNRGLLLRPGMYANVAVERQLGYQLTVPAEAVLNSGTRQLVFLDRGDGRFEPRQVRVGERADDRVVILSGLAAGDLVVTSGNFLIDSESRLKSALQGMEAMPGMEHGERAAPAQRKPAAEAGVKPKRGMEGMPGM